MAAEYRVAGDEVVKIFERMVELYHPDLVEARIGVLLRDVAPRSAGKRVMGKSKKVGPEQKALLPHDFLIWVSEDVWEELDSQQHEALVDHLLCYCRVIDDKVKMAQPDLINFTANLERFGFWWPMADDAEESIQARLGLTGSKGVVTAIQDDVLDQVGDMLGDEEA